MFYKIKMTLEISKQKINTLYFASLETTRNFCNKFVQNCTQFFIRRII